MGKRLYPITGILEMFGPEGWRVPNKTDWKILEEIIDKDGIQALYLGQNWKSNEEASNSSGLSLVPSGFKHKKKFLHQYLNSTIWFDDSTAEGSNWHLHTDGKQR
ncbi:MAG: FISUMP domain-containing protein [Saprospiraceae bacterium]